VHVKVDFEMACMNGTMQSGAATHLREVWRESKGIVELKGILATEDSSGSGSLGLLEALQALLQCVAETHLLIPAYTSYLTSFYEP
jgi:hypothetical protein